MRHRIISIHKNYMIISININDLKFWRGLKRSNLSVSGWLSFEWNMLNMFWKMKHSLYSDVYWCAHFCFDSFMHVWALMWFVIRICLKHIQTISAEKNPNNYPDGFEVVVLINTKIWSHIRFVFKKNRLSNTYNQFWHVRIKSSVAIQTSLNILRILKMLSSSFLNDVGGLGEKQYGFDSVNSRGRHRNQEGNVN